MPSAAGGVSATAEHDMQGDAVTIPVIVWECVEFPPSYNFGGEIFGGKFDAVANAFHADTFLVTCVKYP